MTDNPNMEQRLAVLEREFAILRNEVAQLKPAGNWIERITGSFEGDPDFLEILRLGREIRQQDRPPTES